MTTCNYCNKEFETPYVLCCCCGSFCSRECMDKYHLEHDESGVKINKKEQEDE